MKIYIEDFFFDDFFSKTNSPGIFIPINSAIIFAITIRKFRHFENAFNINIKIFLSTNSIHPSYIFYVTRHSKKV